MTNNGPRIKGFAIFFLSFMRVGFLPKAPGTWGSLAFLPFPFIFKALGLGLGLQIFFFLVLTGLAIFVAEKVQKQYGLHDPGWIVIDEVLGMWLASFFLLELNLLWASLLFVLFRFFDIVKVWPANVIDKKVTHGAGVIVDDLVSGLYAGLLLFVLQKYF